MFTPKHLIKKEKNDYRLIAISDIHGHLDRFKELLRKVNYDPVEDYLVIIGDFVEKGDQVLETIHFIMNLSRFPKCYVLMGNCEWAMNALLTIPEIAGEIPKYLKRNSKNGIIRDIYNHEHFNDGREYSKSDYEFIEKILERYFPENGKIKIENSNDFDIEWIKPDIIVGLGTDVIEGLTHCFECSKKHLSRAKILWEEFNMKYPDHGTLCFNEFTEANKDIEEAYCLYWDSLGNLDQSSCELIGGNDFTDLPHGYQVDIIELANKIRIQRINFQADSSNVPEWNKLRIEIQRLENKIRKLSSNE